MGLAGPRGRTRAIAAATILTAAVVSSVGLAPAVRCQTPSQSGVEEAGALIASVVSRYESAPYEIEFVQQSYWALADSTQVISGTLSVVPPRRIAVRYEDGGFVLADGDSLWIYVAQTNQFFCARLDSTDVFFDPIRLLSTYVPDAASPFGRPEPDAPAESGIRTVTLRPRPPVLEPVRLDVEIDGPAGIVHGLTAHSSAGDRVHYTLRETRLDKRAPDSVFTPSPPPGAERVRGTPYGG